MAPTPTATALSDFLGAATLARELGLVLAGDATDSATKEDELIDLGFRKALSVPTLFAMQKAFIEITDENAKTVYDLLVQYPTGQVEIFDAEKMKSELFSPDYGRLSLVILTDKPMVQKQRSKGLDILSLAGPVFQNPL